MDFEGRNILAQSDREFLDSQKHNFLDFCIKLSSKTTMYVDKDELKNSMEIIYDSLLIKEPNFGEFKTLLTKVFKSNSDFSKYIVTRSFIKILDFYKQNQKQDNFIYIYNAIKRMIEHLNDEVLSDEIKTNTSSFLDSSNSMFQSSSGFMIRQSLGDSFKKLFDNKEKLEFLNLYKGVPVKCEGSIIDLEDEKVVFKINLMQILAIMEEKNAFIIKHPILGDHLRADVLDYSFANNTIKLGNFVRMKNMPATQRRFTRVHPNVTTYVTLFNENNESVRGIMFDISIGGMGVLSANNFSGNSLVDKTYTGCKNGDKIRAEFELLMPRSGEKVKVVQEMELVILLINQGTLRYCMKNINEQDVNANVNTFVIQRKEDTLEDLKEQMSQYT